MYQAQEYKFSMYTLSYCLTLVNETQIHLPMSLKKTNICFPEQLFDWPTNCENSSSCYGLGEGRRSMCTQKKYYLPASRLCDKYIRRVGNPSLEHRKETFISACLDRCQCIAGTLT
jgi:hypothetical protein